jgi:hypothetical protein
MKTIDNILLGTFKETQPDIYEIWRIRLGVATFALIYAGIVYLGWEYFR